LSISNGRKLSDNVFFLPWFRKFTYFIRCFVRHSLKLRNEVDTFKFLEIAEHSLSRKFYFISNSKKCANEHYCIVTLIRNYVMFCEQLSAPAPYCFSFNVTVQMCFYLVGSWMDVWLVFLRMPGLRGGGDAGGELLAASSLPLLKSSPELAFRAVDFSPVFSISGCPI
jgi:hypothetical protein